MSVISLNLINCPDLQADLDKAYNTMRPNQMSSTPLVNFLSSQVNRGDLQMYASGKGKIRTVEVTYSPRYDEDAVGTTITRNCTSSNEAGMSSQSVVVDMGTGVALDETFDMVNLASVCKDNSLWFAQRVQAMIDGCRRGMEKSVADQLALLTGSFSSNDTDGVAGDIKTVSTLASNSLVFDAISEIRYSAQAAEYSSLAYAFGDGLIAKYFPAVESGCCMDAGVDINDFYGSSGIVFNYSRQTSDALGDANGFLVLEAGAAQLVWANLYDGGFNTGDNSIDSFGTVIDRQTGLPFDISIVRNCDAVNVQVSLAFTVSSLPSDMYAIPDHLNGVNGILEFTVSN